MVEVIDLSGYIEEGQPVFPGWQPTEIFPHATLEEVAYRNVKTGANPDAIDRIGGEISEEKMQSSDARTPLVRNILISEHGPTHVDSFSHYYRGDDRSIDKMPLELFFGSAIALDLSHLSFPEYIDVEDLERACSEHGLEIKEEDHVLLHTGNYAENYDTEDLRNRYSYLYEFPALNEDSMRWLIEQGISNVGIDAPSIDHPHATQQATYPAHDLCADNDVLNMENMANIEQVIGKRFQFYAFPLKIRDGTGSPIRPVALVDE